MAIKIYEKFAPRANPADGDHPHGSIKNESVPGAKDGTPLDAEWGNDMVGFTDALLAEAGITPSGNPDTVNASQRLEATKKTAAKASAIPFDNVADLRNGISRNGTLNMSLFVGCRVRWDGYYTRSDGGSNWGIVKSGTHVDDGGSIFSLGGSLYVEANIKGTVSIRKFGASSSLSPEENTLRIQRAIDVADTVNIAYDELGSYKVSKSTRFSTDFPAGDQPCLFVYDKTNFKIHGTGVLEVLNHGQGCIEVQRTSNADININVIGSLDFPLIDGTTGLSEKGSSIAGYDTTSTWQTVKNNSLNTSANTSGGFGGAFPQYVGGTASTWGTWNGGFIGNAGFGILIHNDCHNIKVHKCDITGFNFASIAVGFYGDFYPINRNYPSSTNIKITKNSVRGAYDTGYSTMDCDVVLVSLNTADEIGHPDASYSHTNANPGYGFAARGNDFSISKNITVTSNTFKNCKRKGIDSHAADNVIISNNIVEKCFDQGIFFDWSAATQPGQRATITGNTVKDVKRDGIYLAGVNDGAYNYTNLRLDTVVSSNVITDCDRAGIYLNAGRDVNISNNIIKHGRTSPVATYGIYAGSLVAGHLIYDANINNNTIVAEPSSNMFMGMSLERIIESSVCGNIVRNAGGHGMRMQFECANNIVHTNMARVGADKISFSINQAGGLTYGNLDIGGSGVNLTKTSSRRTIVEQIRLVVAFNGTANPSIVKQRGGDNVNSVVSVATGFDINLQLIGASTQMTAQIFDASDLFPSTGVISCAYKYQRSTSNTLISIGLKETGSSGSHIPASSLTSGQVLIVIDLI